MPLYTGYLPDPYKKFQVAPTNETSTEYLIWNFCYSLFLSFANTTHTETNCKKCDFQIQETSKHVNPPKYQFRKLGSEIIHSLPYIGNK